MAKEKTAAEAPQTELPQFPPTATTEPKPGDMCVYSDCTGLKRYMPQAEYEAYVEKGRQR